MLTSLPSDLSKSSSTSIPNSTSVVSFPTTSVARLAATSLSLLNSTSIVGFPTAPSMSAPPVAVLPVTVSKSTDSATGLPSTQNVSSTFFPQSDSSAVSLPSDSVSRNLTSPTQSQPAPSDTTSKGTDTTVQHTSNTSEPGSTIVSVTVVHTTAGIETSTITTHPASTLSHLVVSTTTDSNGLAIITTPPLITIMSTSTESNGSFVTTTSVVANALQDDVASESGILHNPGAVAGIFSVVGVVFATLVVGIVFWIRRHRRIRQREKWLAGMHPQLPSSFNDDPFRDDNPPVMRSIVTSNAEDGHWDRKGFLTPGSSSYDQQNFEGNPPVIYPIFHDGTFNQRSVGIEPSMEPNRAHFRHSKAPSTPSIYSVSVAPGGDEEFSNDIIVPNFIVPDLNRSATASSLPPRPPRSHLRDRAKSFGFTLPTPPESESSNQTSPISDYVLDRRTIPDVRSRLLIS